MHTPSHVGQHDHYHLSFWQRYCVSLDHKVIGLQYLFTGMVMGLIGSKTPKLEEEDALVRRMEEAAGYAGGLERLAISPQCGFASVMVGNETNEDAQWRKLELVGRVADRLWP